jgi:hypothetical protein
MIVQRVEYETQAPARERVHHQPHGRRRKLKDKDGNTYTTTSFDMFRVANGKIVEHWDIVTKP